MLGTGDELSIQLALLGAAVAFGGVAVTQAGWTHKLLIRSCFAFAFLCLVLGSLWTQVTAHFTSLSQASVGPIFWFALITAAVLYLCFHVSQKPMAGPHIMAMNASATSAAAPPQEKGPIHGLIGAVFAKTNARGPVFRFKPESTMKNFNVFVEHSTFGDFAPGGWTMPRRVHLKTFDKVPKNQIISVDLFGRYDFKDFVAWKFGSETSNKYIINPSQSYRCRTVILDEDDKEFHTYFYVWLNSIEEGPIVIGEHLFDHMNEWEGKPARFKEAYSLFAHS